MARFIDADKLIAEYDRIHVGPPGGARKLMEDAPTADVVPREIVETMHKTIERLEAEKDALIKNYAECQKAYAREIFAEIKRRCANVSRIEYGGFQYYPLGDKFFDELKKKYTEEK